MLQRTHSYSNAGPRTSPPGSPCTPKAGARGWWRSSSGTASASCWRVPGTGIGSWSGRSSAAAWPRATAPSAASSAAAGESTSRRGGAPVRPSTLSASAGVADDCRQQHQHHQQHQQPHHQRQHRITQHPASLQPPPPGGVAWRVSCDTRPGATHGRDRRPRCARARGGPCTPRPARRSVQAGRVPPRTVRRQGRCASLRERLRRPLTPAGPARRGASGSPGWG